MSTHKRKRTAPISGWSVRLKFAFLDFLLLIAVVTSGFAMVNTISRVSSEKYDQIEKTVLSATEQMTTVGIESAVSTAKNIYTNPPLYDFLNKKYSAPAEYYEAYYPLLQNTALNTADTNVVKKCIIYTENPTVLAGGNIDTIDSAKDEEWYKTIKKYNKPTILNIDHKDGTITLVRKLDYIALDTGESYLYLKLSKDFIYDFAKGLDFEGQFYIMSGNDLIYSSDKDVKSVSDINITPDFECLTRNFYTVDIEFYSCADKSGIFDIVLDNKFLLPCLVAILVLFNIAVIVICHGIIRRIRPVLTEFRQEGSIPSIQKGSNGKDEIGMLLDVCAEMSERLTQQGSDYIENNASLMKKSSDYNSLFTTAMRLDAEISVLNKLPFLITESLDDNITLAEEALLLERVAEKSRSEFRNSGIEHENIMIPALSFVLIAEDIIKNYSDILIDIKASAKEAVVTFESGSVLNPTDKLKLNAIFEDEDISSEYSFDKSYRYNPYLRIKHCLGSSVDITMNDKNNMRITFIIRYDKEKGE